MTDDIRENAACFKAARREKPNRHGGINVRTRDVTNRIDHRQDDEAESKRHSHVRNRATGHSIDYDRAGAGKYEAESSQEFCDQLFCHSFDVQIARRSGWQFQLAMLFAEPVNFRANFFQQLPRFRELFRVRASKLRRVRK